MPAYPPGANFRYEPPVRFEVRSGLVVVTDSEGSQALEDGGVYQSPVKGGTGVRVIRSAFLNVFDEHTEKPVKAPKIEKPAEKQSEPTRDELRAEAKALGLTGYSNLTKKKLAAKVKKARA